MITITSTWRCKCGVRVKVISQTPQDRPSATQTAACPKCGDSQLVYGETILSITVDEEVRAQGA
jgi:hypothetical protein